MQCRSITSLPLGPSRLAPARCTSASPSQLTSEEQEALKNGSLSAWRVGSQLPGQGGTQMTRHSLELDISPQRLRHMRWIGGGSGAGKTTIAGLLAEEYGLHLYHCDDAQSAHTARSNAANHSMLHAFLALTMDERWAKRTPEEMFHTFHGFYGEGFGLILEDLLDLPTSVPVLVEGYQLLPRLVAPLLSRSDQAMWLIPTPEWRRLALSRRGSLWNIAGRTSDPQTALANLLARDALYTEDVARQAAALQLPTIEVNGSATVEELVECAAHCLGFRRQ